MTADSLARESAIVATLGSVAAVYGLLDRSGRRQNFIECRSHTEDHRRRVVVIRPERVGHLADRRDNEVRETAEARSVKLEN